jgi:hypothetical protein
MILAAVSESRDKIEKPPSPEHRTFTEALSLALSFSKVQFRNV